MSGIGQMKMLLAVSAAFAMTVLLAGCNKDDNKQGDKNQPPKIVVTGPSCQSEKVEPGDESGPIQSTRHIYDRNCIEVERQIFYRTNHNFEDIMLRPDGTKISWHLENNRGTTLQDMKYATDGQTVVEGFVKRDDGTLQKTIACDDKTNVTTTVTYWWDGKSVFSTQADNADGTFTSEMHHKDGRLWMKRTGSHGYVNHEEAYDDNGTLQYVREPQQDSVTVITNYRPDGTVKYTQTFSVSTYYYGRETRSLRSVDEYGADGKTLTRKITTQSYNNGYGYYYGNGQPDMVERHNADGTVVVHKLSYGGKVSHEEFRDATGKVTSQKDFTWGDNNAPTENIDSSLTNYPATDPQQTWSNTESGSQSRDPAL